MTLLLPPLGMGTASIGNLYRAMDDAEAEHTVAAALASGIGYFDTAPHYGFGLAERRLGRALAGRRDVIVSTKVGRRLEPTTLGGTRHGFVDALPYTSVFDYSREGVLRSHDASLKRLGRDRVEILLAHDLGRLTHGAQHEAMLRDFLVSGYPAMRRLREEGAVDAIGIGVNEVEICLALIEQVELDVILLAGRHTLLDRSAEARLLPACAARGIRVIAGGPYNSGILARPLGEAGDLHYDYGAAPQPIIEQARAMERLCADFGTALPAAALQFPLRHPAVATVLAGLGGPTEVADAVDRLAAPVPEALWSRLDASAEEPCR